MRNAPTCSSSFSPPSSGCCRAATLLDVPRAVGGDAAVRAGDVGADDRAVPAARGRQVRDGGRHRVHAARRAWSRRSTRGARQRALALGCLIVVLAIAGQPRSAALRAGRPHAGLLAAARVARVARRRASSGTAPPSRLDC